MCEQASKLVKCRQAGSIWPDTRRQASKGCNGNTIRMKRKRGPVAAAPKAWMCINECESLKHLSLITDEWTSHQKNWQFVFLASPPDLLIMDMIKSYTCPLAERRTTHDDLNLIQRRCSQIMSIYTFEPRPSWMNWKVFGCHIDFSRNLAMRSHPLAPFFLESHITTKTPTIHMHTHTLSTHTQILSLWAPPKEKSLAVILISPIIWLCGPITSLLILYCCNHSPAPDCGEASSFLDQDFPACESLLCRAGYKDWWWALAWQCSSYGRAAQHFTYHSPFRPAE